MRAKTLELGEIEDSVSPGSSSDSRPKPLSRAKSHVDVQHQPGIARDGAEASLAVPAAPAEPKVEQPESKIPKPDPRADECEDGFADAPMVSREDQREFKEIKEIPIKAKAKAKSNPKSMKRPASSKAYKSKKPASKADGGATDGESEDGLHATQHYSPPSSPVEPRALDGAFKEVASPTSSDADVVPPKRKSAAAKADGPSKKAKVESSKKQRIEVVKETYARMIRAVKVGTDEYYTMDSYDTDYSWENEVLVDDVWMDEDSLQFSGVPEELWSNAPTDKAPGPPEQWIDKMADQVEISRLLDMGAFYKSVMIFMKR